MADRGLKDEREFLEDKKKDQDPSGGVQKPPLMLDPNHKGFKFSIWYILLALLILNILNLALNSPSETVIDFSQFKSLIHDKKIKRIEMGDQYFMGFPYYKDSIKPGDKKKLLVDSTVYKTAKVDDPNFIYMIDSLGIEYYAVPVEKSRLADFFFTWVLPMVLMVGLWRLLFGKMGKLGSGVMSFGQNRAQLVAEGDTVTHFSDVAGADEAKEELVEVVDFLKKPEKYLAIGGKIPKGVLLVGPPGTGKTLLARAVAGEANVPFFRMSGADFVELFVGVGASRVRDLFRQAREKAPCIIFIDELDAIGKTRAPGVGGNDEREQTLNQLLVEMDGFDSRVGVIILAATNRPEILDAALLRPGRFDRQVLIDRPDLQGREAILRIHSRDVKLDDTVDMAAVARSTPGFAGADLANIVNEAALLAVRGGRLKVAQKDFEEAIEKVVAGLQKKSRLINSKERKIVAYHETGHALVAEFTPGSDPVQKITIVPRGFGALGYTLQLPTEERFLMTQDELLGKIDVLLGGRAAEEIIFKQISTGASNDLVKATDIARRMISEYGMSERFQNVVLQSQRIPNYLLDPNATMQTNNREYSETTQQYIDEQVACIIRDRYVVVKTLLATKTDLLKIIADYLLDKEIVDNKDFKRLTGRV